MGVQDPCVVVQDPCGVVQDPCGVVQDPCGVVRIFVGLVLDPCVVVQCPNLHIVSEPISLFCICILTVMFCFCHHMTFVLSKVVDNHVGTLFYLICFFYVMNLIMSYNLSLSACIMRTAISATRSLGAVFCS